MSSLNVDLKTKLAKHLAGCAAASITTGVVVSPDAKAAVVYYQPNGGAGWAIPADNNGLYINVETQVTGTADGSVPGWDFAPYDSTSLKFYTFYGQRGAGLRPANAAQYWGSLALGALVDSGGSFEVNNNAVAVGGGPGEWKLNGSNYFGFRFLAADSQTHYGWGRMDVGASITDRTIKEIGYESVAGAGILVGAKGAPDPVPGPLPLFGAAAAFGWSRRLRRRTLRASGLQAPASPAHSPTPSA